MKPYSYIFVGLLVLILASPSSGQLELNSANFSSEIDLDTSYRWNVENYQIGDSIVETKTSPSAFEFIDGSRIDLTVLKDPSDIDLNQKNSLSNSTGFSDVFELQYDNLLYDFNQANLLYIWIFPLEAIDSTGNRVNLISEFWIYNLYNLLLNGNVYEFNETLPNAEVKSNDNDDEISVTLEIDEISLQARVDKPSGLMNSINFVSRSPDFRIEINRRGAGSALDVNPLFILPGLLLIPILRKIRAKSSIS